MDPLKQAENALRHLHERARYQFHPAYRRYPILFLLLVTFSVAAIFHGFDAVMDEFPIFAEHPLALVLIGVFGLFITGTLYKRLGEDKYED